MNDWILFENELPKNEETIIFTDVDNAVNVGLYEYDEEYSPNMVFDFRVGDYSYGKAWMHLPSPYSV